MSYLKVKNDKGYLKSEKQNWSKFSSKQILDLGETIDWGFSADNLSVEDKWTEFYDKLLKISSKAPKITVKFSRNGAIISKPPWDCTKLKRKRKLKDAAWRTFESLPSTENLHYAPNKQSEYETIRV